MQSEPWQQVTPLMTSCAQPQRVPLSVCREGYDKEGYDKFGFGKDGYDRCVSVLGFGPVRSCL